MRLKKQLSGGRVPHLLRGQSKAREALSRGALGCSACPLTQDTLLGCPGGALGAALTPSRPQAPTAAHLTRGMWSNVQQEPGPSMPHDWL